MNNKICYYKTKIKLPLNLMNRVKNNKLMKFKINRMITTFKLIK